MKVSWIFVLLLIIFMPQLAKSNGQSDSLFVELKKAKHDTTKIRIYNELSELFTKTNPDTAYYFVNEAIRLSELHVKSSDNEMMGVLKKHQLYSFTLLGHYYKALSKYDDAVKSYKNSLKISRELEDFQGEANSFINIGIIKTNKGDYLLAINYFKNAVEIFEKINNEVGLAKVYRNIGNVYFYEGQYDLALESYQKSLALCEKLNDLSSVSRCQGNIGMIHKEMGHYNWSIDYFQKSLAIKKKIGDKRGEATIYNGLGEVHFLKNENEKALEYLNKALEIRKEVKDTRGAAFSMTNIGKVFFNDGNYHHADSFYRASLHIFEEIQDLEQSSQVYNELAKINLEQKNYIEAVRNASISLKIGEEISALPRMRDAYESLYKSYEQQYNINKAFDNFKLYFEFYKNFVDIKDSIQNDIAEKLIRNEQQYKIDQKQREIENQELKLKTQEAAEKNLKLQMSFLLLGFAAMIIFAFVLFRNYKQKTKANQLLREQKEELQSAKEEIEAQKTEIEDSIIYAQNIQKAVLPSFDLREQILPEHFIFFRPRNIVSGDFFWVKKLKNFVVVAIADCTGHGVPGAFMSMLGFMFLNEIVTTRSLDNAGQILNKLREKVKKSLHQSGKEGEAKDGMDMSFFIIDTESKELQFSGAFNPLYIIRENDQVVESEIPDKDGIKVYKPKDDSIEATLFEIKGDRQPIAIYMYEKEFNNYVFQLKPGDRIYSFTDGYPDQFGGEDGKKFNAKRFKEFLLSIRNNSMEKQKELITENFYTWMGDIEQVDDVLLMGVRIN